MAFDIFRSLEYFLTTFDRATMRLIMMSFKLFIGVEGALAGMDSTAITHVI